jgi:hypothetical protein
MEMYQKLPSTTHVLQEAIFDTFVGSLGSTQVISSVCSASDNCFALMLPNANIYCALF